ncbi:hypothetical protein ACFL2Q_17255, partial [Thermodesulfobacteriota bacterium]
MSPAILPLWKRIGVGVYGDKTEEPTMCGLCTWPAITQSEQPNPNVYVNKNGAVLSKRDLDNLWAPGSTSTLITPRATGGWSAT